MKQQSDLFPPLIARHSLKDFQYPKADLSLACNRREEQEVDVNTMLFNEFITNELNKKSFYMKE